MPEISPKIKNVYLPISLIGFAVVLMLLGVLFPATPASEGEHKTLTFVFAKIIMYGLVILLGMGLCSWFGYPFDPTHWSLLQLLAVTLIAGAIHSILNPLAGDMITTIICLVLFLGLVGYFFGDDSMTSLIAIFLIFAAHAMVAFLLMPLMRMILA